MNMKNADMHLKYAGGLQMFLLLKFMVFLTEEETQTATIAVAHMLITAN